MKAQLTIVATAIIFTILSSCKESVDPGIQLTSYAYSSVDESGGTWKPIVLTSADQVPVAAPAPPQDQSYISELSAVKAASANPTSDQKNTINYWSSNGVLRWNEITLELISKYFLLSQPSDDNSYAFPSQTDPSTYPEFPFASPPYSSRALAYLSAGSFDAMIAAWHYKYLYNRNAPSIYDGTIKTWLPVNNLPAYPSEDAVLAGFSRTILTALFPLEGAYLTQQALDEENSRIWAGMNVQSDIVAGDSLGKKIAQAFLARGKTDGMKNTLGTPAQWDSCVNHWAATGQPCWKSLEIPARQPLAINFGHVKPWTFDASLIQTTFRLPPPPAVGSPEFETALNELRDLSKHATTKEKDIAFKWDDGTSTYSPPGHWNYVASPYIAAAKLNPLRAARVLAYMNMSIEDAGIAVWDNKFYYYFPRPTNVDPNIKTILGVPNFPSYPSGHAGFSSAAATVLSYFFPQNATTFSSEAQEAALSRLYGCIHYRFDCENGITLGNNVGQYAVKMAQADGGGE